MMTRKNFVRTTLAAVALGACGDDGTGGTGSGGSGGSDAGECTTPSSTISANHGHTIKVTKEDVAAGVDKTYDISGSSPHSHTVVIPAAAFVQLRDGNPVSVDSTSTDHSHSVTVTCV